MLDLHEGVRELFREFEVEQEHKIDWLLKRKQLRFYARRAERAREVTLKMKLYRFRWRIPTPPLPFVCACGEAFASEYQMKCHGWQRGSGHGT